MNEIDKKFDAAEFFRSQFSREPIGPMDHAYIGFAQAYGDRLMHALESRAISLGYTKDQRDKLFGN